MKIQIKKIAEVLEGELLSSEEAAKRFCTSCSWDSREMKTGAAFFAMPGERVNGARFVESSFKDGCELAIVQVDAPADELLKAKQAAKAIDKALLIVADVQASAQKLAHYWAGEIDAKIIGITGSVGKTSTKNFVRRVLSEKYKVTATKGNQNNEIGMPMTVLSADINTEILITEMGMYHRGEIAELCSIAHPNIALITCVEDCHLETCGSRENVAKAKSEIFEGLGAGDLAILRKDCNFHDLVLEHSGVLISGAKLIDIDDKNYVKNVKLDEFQRPSFDFDFEGQGNFKHCQLKIPGSHNVKNAIFAGVVASQLGMSNAEIKQGLNKCEAEPGRMQILENKDNELTVINDAYNANPQSMRQGIAAFEEIKFPGQKIAVLGSMMELGPDEIEIHREIGDILNACESISKYVFVGELAKHFTDNFSN